MSCSRSVSNIGLLLDCKVTGLTDVEMSLSSGRCSLFPGSLQPTELPTAWNPQNAPTLLPVLFLKHKWDGVLPGLNPLRISLCFLYKVQIAQGTRGAPRDRPTLPWSIAHGPQWGTPKL